MANFTTPESVSIKANAPADLNTVTDLYSAPSAVLISSANKETPRSRRDRIASFIPGSGVVRP